ncbi:MAG: LPS export ABC transporter periplasmic protein LptC [Micavibrio sp.]|nr:LPS export ABC transporter periplasmic protein LptC [Micavibrio sp.]
MNEPRARLGSFGGGNRSRLSALGGGYTWFVRITKIALPLAAVVIIGLIIYHMSAPRQALQLADIPVQEKTTPGQSELISARYEGTDDAGRKYVVTADKAVRDMTTLQAVRMTNPKGEIALDANGWLKVAAKDGLYDNGAGALQLTNGVKITHSSGYEMSLQNVDIDMQNQHAISRNPVTVTGPSGDIAAQGLEVTDDGNLVIFAGPAKMTLRNLKAPAPKAPG